MIRAVQTDTGTENIAFTSERGISFRPRALRIHFAGGSGTADVKLYLDAAEGEEYDVELMTCAARGTGADLNLVWSPDELNLPSGWMFQAGDAIRVEWTNPDPGNMQFGLRFEIARYESNNL